MIWQPIANHGWHEPLAVASAHAGEDMALLYSSRSEHYTGGNSYLLLEPLHVHEGNHWSELPPLPAMDDGLPYFVGHLGYGMRCDGERLARGKASPVSLPDFRLVQYARLLRFDHHARTVTEYRLSGDKTAPFILAASLPENITPRVHRLASNMTRASYEASIAATLDAIACGDFYQANITRKFYGSFGNATQSFALFVRLCTASAAPFSAYLRHADEAVLSSSPESFLSVDASGTITTRPIKGSAPRGTDEASDTVLRDTLLASDKNQAENLMIVDLMRHDLARVSRAGSVQVAEQAGLYSYPTIHHLVSTVTAEKRPDASTYDVVRACFPPGSMTGAPKLAAINWCTAQEGAERGVYSGALGWFGGGGRCELSVVIRTLVMKGDDFEFQVGGGIVADSTPADEWRETLVKARGIAKALGITEEELEQL